MKILLIDIETSPNTAHVWGLFKQNVSINQIIDSSYTMCWAAKWLGDEEVMFGSIYQHSQRKMLSRVHKLLDEADIVIHYNGTKFDIPTLNKEFLLFNMKPPAPYRQIDLLLVARSQFRFPSNKLDYVAKQLGIGQKVHHIGHELWVQCLAKNSEAWKTMEEYNKHDVVLLEDLYNRLKPWIKNHPNVGVYKGIVCCPNCGSENFKRQGWAYTNAYKYQRFSCKECGKWFRNSQNHLYNEPKRVSSV